MAYLLISVEGKAPTRRRLDGPTIVGRSIDSAVWIDDSRLSRQHCRIEPASDGGEWMVIDLNSKNGTLVKGERISAHKLADGDEIFVGRARLVFHARSELPQRPSAPTITSGPSRPIASTEPVLPSSADTLLDSRFPVPQINPKLDSTSRSRPKNKAQRPLPFQRPPAQPRVSEPHMGFVTRMWKRMLRAARR